jgi:glycosyltransferase
MLRFLYKNKISSSYIPEVLVKMRTGGASNVSLSNRLKANREDRLAWKINGLKPGSFTLILKPLSKLRQFFKEEG